MNLPDYFVKFKTDLNVLQKKIFAKSSLDRIWSITLPMQWLQLILSFNHGKVR
jgi:hypothetical protein